MYTFAMLRIAVHAHAPYSNATLCRSVWIQRVWMFQKVSERVSVGKKRRSACPGGNRQIFQKRKRHRFSFIPHKTNQYNQRSPREANDGTLQAHHAHSHLVTALSFTFRRRRKPGQATRSGAHERTGEFFG